MYLFGHNLFEIIPAFTRLVFILEQFISQGLEKLDQFDLVVL